MRTSSLVCFFLNCTTVLPQSKSYTITRGVKKDEWKDTFIAERKQRWANKGGRAGGRQPQNHHRIKDLNHPQLSGWTTSCSYHPIFLFVHLPTEAHLPATYSHGGETVWKLHLRAKPNFRPPQDRMVPHCFLPRNNHFQDEWAYY